ncbi:MAG: hypothetical protein QOE04_1099 [Mycobacterium sp.]|nr:hypothetical protein [Mycobacterium sp.]
MTNSGPPEFDTGQARTNTYHQPDRILKAPEDDGDDEN